MKKILGLVMTVAALSAFADWQDATYGSFTVPAFHPNALELSQGVLNGDAAIAKITISQDNYCYVATGVQIGTEQFFKANAAGTMWRTRSGQSKIFHQGSFVQVTFRRAAPGRCTVNWQAQVTDNPSDN